MIVSVLVIGCASKDTDSDEYSMKTKESSTMTQDSTGTMPMQVDSIATTMTTSDTLMGKMQKAMPDPAKKG